MASHLGRARRQAKLPAPGRGPAGADLDYGVTRLRAEALRERRRRVFTLGQLLAENDVHVGVPGRGLPEQLGELAPVGAGPVETGEEGLQISRELLAQLGAGRHQVKGGHAASPWPSTSVGKIGRR